MSEGLRPLNRNGLPCHLKIESLRSMFHAAQAFHFDYLVFNAESKAVWEALKFILRT